MDAATRQQRIVDLARERGLVQVQWLAEQFQVTPQTIRRDVDLLAEAGSVRRFRGGVAAPSSTENVAYTTRKMLMAEEKRRIARLVAEQVPDEASLFINIGTTTEAVAQALSGHRGLRVVTNNLNVAAALHQNTGFAVSMAGGHVRAHDGGIVGEAAVNFIRQFKVDIGIIGISGIDTDGDLLDFDEREVRIARAILEKSRRIFLVADHTKFGRSAMIRMGSLAEVDAVFTDRTPTPEFEEVLAASECAVFVAPGEDGHVSGADARAEPRG